MDCDMLYPHFSLLTLLSLLYNNIIKFMLRSCGLKKDYLTALFRGNERAALCEKGEGKGDEQPDEDPGHEVETVVEGKGGGLAV
jgi:hypothetical protein